MPGQSFGQRPTRLCSRLTTTAAVAANWGSVTARLGIPRPIGAVCQRGVRAPFGLWHSHLPHPLYGRTLCLIRSSKNTKSRGGCMLKTAAILFGVVFLA